MTNFYHMRNAESAQIQATGIWLQITHHIIGWAPKSWFSGDRRASNCGPIGLAVWTPISSCGMRRVLELRLFRLKIIWMTKGETFPGHHLHEESGFHLTWKPSR